MRYLISVDVHGMKIQLMDVTDKSLVDAESLVRDMSLMYKCMGELVRRVGILNGNCNTARVDNRID